LNVHVDGVFSVAKSSSSLLQASVVLAKIRAAKEQHRLPGEKSFMCGSCANDTVEQPARAVPPRLATVHGACQTAMVRRADTRK
jgi:hypothetical protein